MQLEAINTRLKTIKPELRAKGLSHLAIFGSRVRGDARSDSDLDILLDVAVNKRFSILDLVGVEALISDALGIRVNAFMRRSLEPNFATTIAPDVRQVF